MFKFIVLGFCFLLSSCNNSLVKKEKRINPKAVSYIDSATKVLLTTGDYQKAIKLTELAIAIDSDFVSAYEHLFGYCLILKEYDKALRTSLKLNKIRPYRADFISSTGLVFFFMHDTLNGKKYLQKSTLVYQNIVDTLKRDKYPKEYFDIKSAQAFNLTHIAAKTTVFHHFS